MIIIVDKMSIIQYKKRGHSNRRVAKMMGINRQTVAKYWNQYLKDIAELNNINADKREVQEKIIEAPKYNSENRRRIKFTAKIEEDLHKILELEAAKNKILGSHRQQLTKKQIHEELIEKGHDISYCTINIEVNKIRKKAKECFIRQEYDLGDRLEYDFGEVKLYIDGRTRTYHMAVLSSPGGDLRWAYLYTNQKKDVFLDSHVEFFEMMGGAYKEVVYDNMKNVVSRFIGRNERELNEDLVKLSIYYGYTVNVTNCFKPNEKGHVESSVKILRNKLFATNYKFNTLDEAREYMRSSLMKLNENSKVEEEKQHLLDYKPKLELANISENIVNSYSFIRFQNNHYSVPEYLVGKKVTVKSYYDKIIIYAHNKLVCDHKKPIGVGHTIVNISHYLKTLYRKPGAIRNSLALKSIPSLKSIYDTHYSDKPRKFIKLLMDNQDCSIGEIVEIFQSATAVPSYINALDVLGDSSLINSKTKEQISIYNTLSVRSEV